MAGIRIGGSGIRVASCSPPVTAYGGSATSGDPQVWRACGGDAPGTMTQITDFSGFTDADQCMNPVLSPDGTKILFEIDPVGVGGRQIWIVDAVAGSTPTALVVDVNNYVMDPSWGLDSDTFTYVHSTTGGFENGSVYKDTVSSPGSPTLLRTPTAGWSCFRPQFNFDGSRVAYLHNHNTGTATCDLRVMDDDGSNDASLDSGLTSFFVNQPPQFSWANTQNLIAYFYGVSGPNDLYLIADDGTGQTLLNANGDGAGANARLSKFAWPADDSWVLYTSQLGFGDWSLVRAELDGSDTTQLGTAGAANNGWMTTAQFFNGRIWFIDSASTTGKLSSVAADGSDYVNAFNSSSGSGDQVEGFAGGDGFYFDGV